MINDMRQSGLPSTQARPWIYRFVESLVDNAHSAFAEQTYDAVWSDALHVTTLSMVAYRTALRQGHALVASSFDLCALSDPTTGALSDIRVSSQPRDPSQRMLLR